MPELLHVLVTAGLAGLGFATLASAALLFCMAARPVLDWIADRMSPPPAPVALAIPDGVLAELDASIASLTARTNRVAETIERAAASLAPAGFVSVQVGDIAPYLGADKVRVPATGEVLEVISVDPETRTVHLLRA